MRLKNEGCLAFRFAALELPTARLLFALSNGLSLAVVFCQAFFVLALSRCQVDGLFTLRRGLRWFEGQSDSDRRCENPTVRPGGFVLGRLLAALFAVC